VNIDFSQRFNGVLNRSPGHAGLGNDGWHSIAAVIDQVGDIKASVEAGFGFAVHGFIFLYFSTSWPY
jgi:hypothetical protein